MPKKVKKSKPSIMKQKQVVNINITNPKRKAKRVKSQPKKSSNLYPAQQQSHNSGSVLPFYHQFYIPPTDKSMPQIEELTNKFRDGNLLQIKQNNDLMNQLEGSHKLINQLAQQSMKEKSPKKLYEQLMQEHINRQNTKTISHIDGDGNIWEEDINANQTPSSPTRKKINKILKQAITSKGQAKPKNTLLSTASVQPLDETNPSEPTLIPKTRGRPPLTEEQKAQNKELKAKNKAEQQALKTGSGAGVSEFKSDDEKTTKAKQLLGSQFKRYSNRLKESNAKVNSLFADYDADNLGNIGAPIQAEETLIIKVKKPRQKKK
jgi:hypothetical protein